MMMMRSLHRICLLAIALLVAASTAWAQASYADTQVKANRFFQYKEWASALAMYNFMLKEQPECIDTYGRAIVSAEMIGDKHRAMELLKQALDYSVPLDSVLTNVRKYSFAIGKGDMYENFMLNASADYPWLERPLDAYLLRYYAFRRNGFMMVQYAQKMLKSSPENIEFLLTLAEGYMIDGQPQLALDTWMKAYQADNKCYLAIINMANLYDMQGDADQARTWFEKAYAIKPTPYVEKKLTNN